MSIHCIGFFARGVSRGGFLENFLEGGVEKFFLHFSCVFRAFEAILNFENLNFWAFQNCLEGGSKIVSGRGLPSPRPLPYAMYAHST